MNEVEYWRLMNKMFRPWINNYVSNLGKGHSCTFCIYFKKTNESIFQVAFTVKFLNFRTPENFAVIYLIFKQKAQLTLGYFVKKMQME